MTREFDIPYWKQFRLSAFNDHFRIMYQDYDYEKEIGKIDFEDDYFIFYNDEAANLCDEDKGALKRFEDSLAWKISTLHTPIEQRNLMLEFHIANTNINSDYIRVYYKDEYEMWQHESWDICKYDNFIEIVNPKAQSSGEIQRFHVQDYSPKEILNWLLCDIESICGKEYVIMIDFGNR